MWRKPSIRCTGPLCLRFWGTWVLESRCSAGYLAYTLRLALRSRRMGRFPIFNSTRQGCPLSPLLFALSLEPFLNRIRLNPDVSGIQVGDLSHKVSAYADDLFSLTNPQTSKIYWKNLIITEHYQIWKLIIPNRRQWESPCPSLCNTPSYLTFNSTINGPPRRWSIWAPTSHQT